MKSRSANFLKALELLALILLLSFSAGFAIAEEVNETCSSPQIFDQEAFRRPMEFASGANDGNMTTSAWIIATGKIGPETPDRFRAFLASEHYQTAQIVFNSPGGNLAGGVELGRIIRQAGLTAHIGRTERLFSSYGKPCVNSEDIVTSGICASACAYAFLGGLNRFVNSPYYPGSGNLLGFHQFYGSSERGSDMLTPEQVEEIETTSFSVAQAITGKIVLYAVEMGVDPRIVAFASATPSNDLYYPTAAEIEEFSIASGSRLGAWRMKPYGDGVITSAEPSRSDSMLTAITAFCLRNSGAASFVIAMEQNPNSHPDPYNLPINAVDLSIDRQKHSISKRELSLKYEKGQVYITFSVEALKQIIVAATEIEVRLDAARVMGGFREGRALDDNERKSLAIAWRNCI